MTGRSPLPHPPRARVHAYMNGTPLGLTLSKTSPVPGPRRNLREKEDIPEKASWAKGWMRAESRGPRLHPRKHRFLPVCLLAPASQPLTAPYQLKVEVLLRLQAEEAELEASDFPEVATLEGIRDYLLQGSPCWTVTGA